MFFCFFFQPTNKMNAICCFQKKKKKKRTKETMVWCNTDKVQRNKKKTLHNIM